MNGSKADQRVPEKDNERFAQEVVLLATDGEMRNRLGTAARTRAVRFTNDTIMKHWVSLFKELTS